MTVDGLSCGHCGELFAFGDHPEETFQRFARHHDQAHPDCEEDNNVDVVVLDLVAEESVPVEDLGIVVGAPPTPDKLILN